MVTGGAVEAPLVVVRAAGADVEWAPKVAARVGVGWVEVAMAAAAMVAVGVEVGTREAVEALEVLRQGPQEEGWVEAVRVVVGRVTAAMVAAERVAEVKVKVVAVKVVAVRVEEGRVKETPQQLLWSECTS